MTKRLILTGTILILVLTRAIAQEQLTLKQTADQLYQRFEYFKSLQYYLKIVTHAKTNVRLLERIADCYRNISDYQQAEQWYEKATATNKSDRVSHYNYAEVLLRNQKFDLAKVQYKAYYLNDAATLQFKLNACDSALLWMSKPSRYKIDNAAIFNSNYSDWGTVYDQKSSILFTSDRQTDNGTDNRTGNGWFKLYQTNLSTQKTRLLLINPGNTDFKDDYHVGPIALNKTSDTAYITLTTDIKLNKLRADQINGIEQARLHTRRLQLVMAVKQNDGWVLTQSFPYNNVQQYSVGNAALSPNGKLIYFSSDMPGGEGETDIWYCEKLADDTWGKPQNCGKTINTKSADSFPYIDNSGALYYASKGLPGMGGYDIYSTKGAEAKWSTPQNLKYPVNTTSDDFYLVTHDGLNGYLSSNREGGQGSDDIYSFSLLPDTLPMRLIVTEQPKTAEPKPNYVIKTIYYDLNKSSIRADAALELDKLAVMLKTQPGLKVELSSYTDSRASFSYNMALSRRRAIVALKYLVAKGVSRIRLTANGYGETHLVNQCADHVKCTEANHLLNRRTEFKLTGNNL